LRKPLQEVLPRNDGAARYIADAVGETRSNDLSAEEWLRSLGEPDRFDTTGGLQLVRKVPTISGYLDQCAAQKCIVGLQDKTWQEDLTSLLIETHNLAESVFQWLLKNFQRDVRRLPDSERSGLEELDEGVLPSEILRTLPAAQLTDDTVRRLASQNLREIRNAACSRQ
jgi:hypothetical protein